MNLASRPSIQSLSTSIVRSCSLHNTRLASSPSTPDLPPLSPLLLPPLVLPPNPLSHFPQPLHSSLTPILSPLRSRSPNAKP
ncbi:hypothetical protein K440DRAFT_304258 [Wilcoxina mikolae CBS 423.85]|nr:hypothetical protein K440DRAFT_304258 [Wilcoxina mikolae CBS 423.85]